MIAWDARSHWLYAHDPTKLFAGIAHRARQVFGVQTKQLHVDTTSFSVNGEYASKAVQEGAGPFAVPEIATDPALIAITYGYSRDHREDLKQWMLALATTHDGDIPVFLQPLDGNSSDKVSLLSAIEAIQEQLCVSDEIPSVYVADNGVYSTANMTRLNQAGVKWISRVSETMTEAKALLEEGSESWQQSEDGSTWWFCRQMSLPQGEERWVVLSTQASVERARQTMMRQVNKAQKQWESTCWHFSNRRFACEADARAAWEREQKGKPAWLDLSHELLTQPVYGGKGRPRKDALPTGLQWQIKASVSVNFRQVVQGILRKACWIVGTNVLEPAQISDQALSETYKDQGGVERGFRFLKDPLFLASSVFVKSPNGSWR